MRKLTLFSPAAIAAITMLAACSGGSEDQQQAPAGGPPPDLKPFVMREELPQRDRLKASISDGEAIFSNRCGYCHLEGGMGTNLLTKQQMLAGNPPQMGLLANREDLTADYVKSVVRNGKVAMPPISRTEVTDAELNAIASYLGKGK